MLCREIFDLAQKKTLGYIVIGFSRERLEELCESILEKEKESVMILDPNGGELSCVGDIDKDVKNI